ncbi:MAG: hypothetical protein PHP64_08950 [Actinomycetota bacterium]|nr:hypothetical protein [Actinomycetota bacterium]
MIPFDSFLIDGPWLVSLGWIFGKLVDRYFESGETSNQIKGFLGVATVVCFWVTSVSLYFNLRWVRWLWEMCGAESGRDWMINSGVFNFDHENMSASGHALAALLFLLYPVWIKAGFKLSEIGKKEEAEI